MFFCRLFQQFIEGYGGILNTVWDAFIIELEPWFCAADNFRFHFILLNIFD